MQSTIYGRDGVELYDLAEDPHEQTNVADQHPEVVAAMGAQLQHWLSAQLAGRPDPMLAVIDAGLPAVARLHDVVAEALRPAAEESDPTSGTDPDPARQGGRRGGPGSGAGRCRPGGLPPAVPTAGACVGLGGPSWPPWRSARPCYSGWRAGASCSRTRCPRPAVPVRPADLVHRAESPMPAGSTGRQQRTYDH